MNDKFELKNENVFELIINCLPDFVAIVMDEKFLCLNLMAQSLLKCSNLCEIVGESVYTFIDSGNHEVIRTLLMGEIDSDKNNSLQMKIRTVTGDSILLQVTLKYFVWNDSRAMMIVGRNVSEELTQKCAINENKDEVKPSELYYREVFDYSSESLFLLEVLEDSDFRILDINPQFEKAVGVSREICIGKAIKELLSYHLVSELNKRFQSCVAARAEIETEIELDLSVGLRTFRSKLVPIFDESGNVCRINGVLWDVTEREKVESNLHEEFELFVGGPSVAYKCRYIDGWPVEFVSPNVFEQFGYTQQNLTDGKISVVDIIHPDDFLRVNEEVKCSIELMQPSIEQEFRIVCKDGKYILVHTFTVFAKDAGGNITHLKGYLRDITGRKKQQNALFEAEEQKSESERPYREMFDNSHDSILLLEVLEDSQFRLLEINAQCEREIGINREQSVGKLLTELAVPGSAAIVTEKYQRCIELGTSTEELVRLEMPKGLRFIHSVLVPVRDSFGRIYRIISLSRDVTDQHKIKQQLELNRNLLVNAEVVASVGHFYMDFSNEEFHCSRGIYSILELPYKEEDVESLDVFKFVHTDDMFRVKKSLLYAYVNKTKFNKVHRIIDSNGVEKMVRSSATFIVDTQNRELLIGSMQDVSDLYSLKDQVVVGEEKLRLLAENSPIGLFVMNGGTPVYINQSLLKLLGVGSLSEFVKINIYDLVHPADRCSVLKLKEKISKGNVADALSCQLTIRFLDQSGVLKILDLRFIACCLEGDRYLQIMVIDITDEIERETLMNQLTSDSLYMSKKKDIIANVKTELNDILIDRGYKKSDFRNIINLLDSYSKDESEWGFFNTYFENLHPGLISNLKIICPTLTVNDIKHCACIRLNIDTKETARFFNVTPASIQTSRVRLKKKLNLPESVDLRVFIENL